MIPTSDMQNVLGGPRGVSNAESAHFDMLESDFTCLSPQIRNAYHEQVIKGPFSKQLAGFTTLIAGEITNFMEHKLGRDNVGLVEIKIFDTMAQVVASTVNRVFVGEELCKLKARSSRSDC
jgi:hypothetical protein